MGEDLNASNLKLEIRQDVDRTINRARQTGVFPGVPREPHWKCIVCCKTNFANNLYCRCGTAASKTVVDAALNAVVAVLEKAPQKIKVPEPQESEEQKRNVFASSKVETWSRAPKAQKPAKLEAEELRQARDGNFYSLESFLAHYVNDGRGQRMWEEAAPADDETSTVADSTVANTECLAEDDDAWSAPTVGEDWTQVLQNKVQKDAEALAARNREYRLAREQNAQRMLHAQTAAMLAQERTKRAERQFEAYVRSLPAREQQKARAEMASFSC